MSAIIQHNTEQAGFPLVDVVDCMERVGGEGFVGVTIDVHPERTLITNTDPTALAEWWDKMSAKVSVDLHRVAQRHIAAALASGTTPTPSLPEPHWSACTCIVDCAEDPATACSLSGRPHCHAEPADICGPCPVHPEAEVVG